MSEAELAEDYGTLTLDEYQQRTRATAIYPGRDLDLDRAAPYLTLKLNGEAGEVAELIGKGLRGDYLINDSNVRLKVRKELGDVLWYVAALAHEYGWDMSQVAGANLEKLQSRKERGVLQGNGSER